MSDKGRIYFKKQAAGIISREIDGIFKLQYEKNGPSISLTLPNLQEVYTSEELFPFFDGLIPEGWLLNLIQKNWKLPKNDRMSLLLTTCRDCIGAASIVDFHDISINDGFENSVPVLNHEITNLEYKLDRCLICTEKLSNKENLYHSKCAKELFGFKKTPIVEVSQENIEDLALLQINQRLILTGVQKKLSLSSITKNKKERLTIVGLDGHFILKPATDDFPEMPVIEHISMKLAELQGLTMAKCGLVYLRSGELAYLTKRFDRTEKDKVLVEDFCQLSNKMTNQKYTGSGESLGKVIDKFSTSPSDDKLTLFQVLLFSFWIGNADMHLKNFSLWSDPNTGLIRMSPGYDHISTRLLISVHEDKEELALPINGKKNKIKWEDFLALGANLKIAPKVLESVKEKMLDTFPSAESLIYQSFLNDKMKEDFVDLIAERSKRLI